MILKKLKRTSFKKSKAVMIGGVADYILAVGDGGGNERTKSAGAVRRTPEA
jgi:hypothetical protein